MYTHSKVFHMVEDDIENENRSNLILLICDSLPMGWFTRS